MPNNIQKFLSPLLCVCLLLNGFVLTAAENHGQVSVGGVPVPGAKVTAIQGEKKFTTVTDADGIYSFADLGEGTWTMQVEMRGFTTLKNDVAATASPMWELKMMPLSQMNAKAQSELRSEVRAAPVPVAPKPPAPKPDPAKPAAGQPAAPPPDPTPAEELSQRAADGFLVNGSTNNGASSPFGLNPAFGNNRRGARSPYNGNIGMTLDHSALDARQFSLTGQDTPKPQASKFTGLFNIAGPVKIPKLLPRNGPNFTVNYQWGRSHNGSVQTNLMPTSAQRNGDLSYLTTPVIDPTTGTPFLGNQIPLTRISTEARALLAYYPQPNFTGSNRYNYQIPIVSNQHSDSLQARMNRGVGRKNQLSGAFSMQSNRGDSPNLFGFLDTNRSLGFNTNITWRRTFTPRYIGTFAYTFSRQSNSQIPFFANRPNGNVSALAGISGNNQEPVNWGPPSLGFSTGFAGLSDGISTISKNQTGTAAYDSTWNHGRHNFAFGGDYRHQQFATIGQQNPRGNFTFTGLTNFGTPTDKRIIGSDFASFLLGLPDLSQIAFGNADKYLRAKGVDAYLNDDWRIRPSLTLNLGIRWEYSSPVTEKYGRLVNLDVASDFTKMEPVKATEPIGKVTGLHYADSLVNPYKRGLQPRLGLAWRPIPGSNLIIRAGYGLSFDSSGYQNIARQMWQQSPLSTSLRVSNSAASLLTLANGFVGSPNITSNTFGIDPDFRLGYAQNWQVSAQKDLPYSLQMVATYMGTKGTHAIQQFLPNTFPVGGVDPCPSCPSGFTYMTSNGNSTREAGVLQLRRRMRNGFQASLQYTYAHAIDDAALGGAGSGNVIAQDWLNLAGERGRSNFDQRHLMNVSLQYTTGLGVGGGMLMTGWRGAAFKEWTFVTNVNTGSGLPLSPVYVAATGGSGVNQNLRPNYSGLSVYDAPAGLSLNPAAYVIPALGTYGNAARNSITGPSQFSMNATMQRTFRLNDRLAMDIQASANNLLNHVTYPSWNTSFVPSPNGSNGNVQFGLPSSANGMRNIQTNVRVRF